MNDKNEMELNHANADGESDGGIQIEPKVNPPENERKIEIIRSHRKRRTSDKVFTVCNTVFMILFSVITLYPVLNTLAISLNDGLDAVRGGIHLIPRVFSLKSYQTVLGIQGFVRGAFITVSRTVLGTLFALVANALLAYIISRKRFLFRSELSLFWVITMYVSGGLIPTMVLYKALHLTNSFWVYVIPGMVSAFNVMVLRTYMEGLPDELEESAQLDGAGYMTIFVRVISPLCKPVYATVALFVAVYQWNSWFDAMIYNRMKPEYTTLQYELMKLLNSVMQQSGSATGGAAANGGNVSAVTPVSVRSAATIITMLPIVCLYPFLQRYFVTGLTIGGVKG
ncbi:MAG: carbohydrate ABC transporter permease [Lachnospiraceae bacterium]